MGHERLEVARLAKQCEPEAGHSGDGTGGVEYPSVKGSRRSCAIQSSSPRGRMDDQDVSPASSPYVGASTRTMYFCDYETASSPAAPLSAQAQKSDVYVSPLIENAYRGARGHPHRCCRHRERAEEKSWMWPTTVAYSQIAPFYDCTVGMEFFLRVRQAFSKLVRRYGIRFCSAGRHRMRDGPVCMLFESVLGGASLRG